MRKIILAAVIAGSALTLTACSEAAEEAPVEDAAMADAETNADAMVDTTAVPVDGAMVDETAVPMTEETAPMDPAATATAPVEAPVE